MLELVKSEYPVIQELALVALERVTQDADNRSVFLFMGERVQEL